MTELDLLVRAIAEDLGDPSDWSAPVEFRDSLALCALNSAYSLRATSAAATRVLARYRASRPTADTDSGTDLMNAMDGAGEEGTEFGDDVLFFLGVSAGRGETRDWRQDLGDRRAGGGYLAVTEGGLHEGTGLFRSQVLILDDGLQLGFPLGGDEGPPFLIDLSVDRE